MADAKEENVESDEKLEQSNKTTSHSINHHALELDHETFTRPGAQLSERQTFCNKKGEKISGFPLILDLKRLLQLSPKDPKADIKEHGIIPGVITFISLFDSSRLFSSKMYFSFFRPMNLVKITTIGLPYLLKCEIEHLPRLHLSKQRLIVLRGKSSI